MDHKIALFIKYQKIISIRDFRRQLTDIVSKPECKLYVVVKNGKHVGTYIPKEFEETLFSILFNE